MTLSLLPVLISTVITIGILYVLYTKFFIKFMNFKGDGKDKLISYSFLIGIITLGMGLMTIFNELLFVQFNNSTIQSKVIERGIFTLIFYPIVFWSLGFILHKVFKKSVQDINQSKDSSIKISKNHLLIGGGVLGVILVISMMSGTDTYQTSSSTSSSNKNEKEFKISKCSYFDKSKQKWIDSNLLTSMIVNKDGFLFIEKDGSIYDSKDMKCNVIPTKNYMFMCKTDSGITYKFDGESSLTQDNEMNCIVSKN
jgi:hypothetical protein